MSTIGKYSIGDMCMLTYPCQHYVTNSETNETTLMSGDNIYEMLTKEGLSDEHFDVYAEYIRKRDHPTDEELAEKEKQRKRKELIRKKRRELIKQNEENRQLGIKSGASSRLARLKAKHTQQ